MHARITPTGLAFPRSSGNPTGIVAWFPSNFAFRASARSVIPCANGFISPNQAKADGNLRSGRCLVLQGVYPIVGGTRPPDRPAITPASEVPWIPTDLPSPSSGTTRAPYGQHLPTPTHYPGVGTGPKSVPTTGPTRLPIGQMPQPTMGPTRSPI